jgi:hypothetical protein
LLTRTQIWDGWPTEKAQHAPGQDCKNQQPQNWLETLVQWCKRLT